jgi:hypothetical protein
LIVNDDDHLVEVRKIKLSLLRVSILLKEKSAPDKKSLCVREFFGKMDNLSKNKKVDCIWLRVGYVSKGRTLGKKWVQES